MTLISYSQNHEDILLWRCLSHIKNGFYVDVGASDPQEDSVTKLFYDNSWHGINIEPSVSSFQRLCDARKQDTNLCCAVAEYDGIIQFYDVPTRGWSTSDPSVGRKYLEKDDKVKIREVDVFRLNTLLKKYCALDSDIHFLKIDVEGAEAKVLEGLDLSSYRPWILVIESIEPITNEASHEQWELSILKAGYQFVHFDGLNRFYLADEHVDELQKFFISPPNVLDDFVPSIVVRLQQQAQLSQGQVKTCESKVQEHESKVQEYEGKVQEYEGKVQEYEGKVQEYEGKVQEYENKVQELEQVIHQLNDHIKLFSTQTQQYENKINELRTTVAKLNKTIVQLNEHVGLAEQHSQQYASKIQELESTVHQLSEHLQFSKNETRQHQNAVRRHVEKIQKYEADIHTLHGHIKAQDEHIKAQNKHISLIEHQAQLVKTDLDIVYASRSWLITAPLRKVGNLVRKLAVIKEKIVTKYNTPRKFLGGVKRKVKEFVRSKYSKIKSKYLKIKLSLRTTKDPRIDEDALVANFSTASANKTEYRPSFSGEQIIYLFVDHTISCSVNTGVQRVTRGMAKALKQVGEEVRYVKWDAQTKQLRLINQQERSHLSNWNGPAVTAEDLKIYGNAASQKDIAITEQLVGKEHWLLVPEVTHITPHTEAVTMDLILWARRMKLKIGFLFYDAIPLQREEFASIVPKHATYMKELLLADQIFPISKWVAKDLFAFWRHSEAAGEVTMPKITPLLLSGESDLSKRTKTSLVSKKIILSVGTIEPRKNQVALIKVFEQYCQENTDTDWQLILVGNLHPLVAEFVNKSVAENPRIINLGHINDQELDQLYEKCAFTVYPSINEGFGLPILESLWYGKPCICANFGSMAEVAEGGGCLTVNVHDQQALAKAIEQLMSDQKLHDELTQQALTRHIRTWDEYAGLIRAEINAHNSALTKINYIYFWIDGILAFPKNTGIQRVSRQLARALMELGFKLIPVKSDKANARFQSVAKDELQYFSKWNGPSPELWHDWVEPDGNGQSSCFFMPDLPLNLSTGEQLEVISYAKTLNLQSTAIFYDAIPWKMKETYPPHFSQAHREYMIGLAKYDLILPISLFSGQDLTSFLGRELLKPQSLAHLIQPVPLAGEFSETPRILEKPVKQTNVVTILCVGTVEPRKNHETLLLAFELLKQRSSVPVELVIIGRRTEPDLADTVLEFIARDSSIIWQENVDDQQLHSYQLNCDFTVYPSLEEGFGLPIQESLWYGKPCICANFGAMAEAAQGGGCLMVDVRNCEDLARSLQSLVEDQDLYQDLLHQALNRSFKSWQDYGAEVAAAIANNLPNLTAQEHFLQQLSNESVESLASVMNLQYRPLLSVCISTYNRAEWLLASLENLKRLYPEPIPEVEFLVCDNASTDNTSDSVKPFLSRSDFSYYRNEYNVGMLGNLRKTVSYAAGKYIWILGDDDLVMPGSIEKVLQALKENPETALVYLNYAFTRIEDARTIKDFDAFFKEATPIVPAEGDNTGLIKNICARNENFFTAIYTLVFRRDHALKAYSQDTSGRPFSTMLTCIPTTYYVLNHMMNEPGVWIGEPQLVVNMNVSWMKYAPLWILERIPEVYEEAERRGVSSEDIDRWRRHTLPGVLNFFREIFENDPLDNAQFFTPSKLIRRFKHLPEFQKDKAQFINIYEQAQAKGHPAAIAPISQVFPE